MVSSANEKPGGSINDLLDTKGHSESELTVETARAALDAHTELFPLNKDLMASPDPPSEDSHAVRYNRTAKLLLRAGFPIKSAWDADFNPETDIRSHGNVPRGNFHALHISPPGETVEERLALAAVIQRAFNDNGIRLAVTHEGDLLNNRLGSDSGTSLAELNFIELGGFPYTQPHTPEEIYIWISQGRAWTAARVKEWSHLGMATALEWAPHPLREGELLDSVTALVWIQHKSTKQEMDRWIRADERLHVFSRAHSWMADGFTPEQAGEWLTSGSAG